MSSASTTFGAGGTTSPTAAQVNGWAQGTLGYAQVTANQGSITTQVDLTNLTVTVTVVAGRRIKITGYVPECVNATIDTGGVLYILKDGSQIQQCDWMVPTAATGVHATAIVVDTPAAGSHTYKLQMSNQSGGTVTMQCSAVKPAFILVEDIGAV